jgi:hypothetical protein
VSSSIAKFVNCLLRVVPNFAIGVLARNCGSLSECGLVAMQHFDDFDRRRDYRTASTEC